MSNSLSDPEQVATVDLDVSPPRRKARASGPYTGIVLATCVLFVLSAIFVPKSLSQKGERLRTRAWNKIKAGS